MPLVQAEPLEASDAGQIQAHEQGLALHVARRRR